MLLNRDAANLLGLMVRAGALVSGSQVLPAVRQKQAVLVLLASDSSQGTQKQVTDKCHYYQVECLMVEDSQALSTAIGKHNRKSVAILNAGFAKKLKEKLGVGEEYGETK